MPTPRRSALAPILLLLSLPAPALAAPGRVGKVTIEGRTLEDKGALARFLGLVEGAAFPDEAELRSRVDEAIKQLGYHKLRDTFTARDGALDVHLHITPAPVVRHVRVKRNWPVSEEEIRRRLTLRPGSRLPPKVELAALIDREVERIKEHLRRDGYFEGDAAIVVKPIAGREWVDLDVIIHRGRTYKLVEVDGSGNRAVSNREMLRRFGARWYQPGWLGRLRPDRFRDDAGRVEAQYRDLGYPAARVLPEFDSTRDLDPKTRTARLRVVVTEKARVEIEFAGNRAYSNRQLERRTTIRSAGSYDEVELAESARELQRFYQSGGYLEVVVTWTRRRVGEAERITFTIDEGPQLRVRSVDFVPEAGGAPLTATGRELAQQVSTRVFPLIGLGAGGYVTDLQLAQDVEKLVAWERARGYPEARVRAELVRDPEAFGRAGVLSAQVAAGGGLGDDLYVRFFIEEGRHETIGSVTVSFAGDRPAAMPDVAALLELPAGTPFAADTLRAAIKRVPDAYAARGHPYVRVETPSLHWNDAHTVVDIALSIDEGPEVRFGEILVRGNFQTREWVIRRNLPFRTGDLFDVTRIAEAERNLQTHGIFNGVRVIPLGLAARVNPVPILIDVQQERYDNYGEVLLAVGYSTDVGLSLLPGYLWGNVFGGGGQLQLRLELAVDPLRTFPDPVWDYTSPFFRRLSASLRYVHPHFILPSLRLEVAGFVRKEDTVRLGEVDSAGASTSLSWVYSPRFRLFGRYDWTLSSLQSIEFQRLPGRGDFVTVAPDQTRTGRFTLGVVFDDRISFDGSKNALMPISGTLVAFAASIASVYLGGTQDFVTVSGQLQRFQPLGAGVTLIGHLRGDWGIPLGGNAALPAVDRFFAGGDVATRGYQTDSLRTEIVRFPVSPAGGDAGFRVIPQGGNIRFLFTAELQFPITTILGFPWVGALFFDAGTVFDSPLQFDVVHDVKCSVGLSLLRLLTPVGPISLEYAYPLTQTLAEQGWKTQPWFAHWPGLIHFNWGIPILR